MILFLDFDGVLHPQYEGQTVPSDVAFCHLPRFEDVMRDFPAVKVVISSTWREQFGLTSLKSRFSPDIAARIIGITPIYPLSHPPAVMQREWEITTWLSVRGLQDAPWIALDDAIWEFKNNRDNVIACTSHAGFSAATESKLRAALSLAFADKTIMEKSSVPPACRNALQILKRS